MGRLRNCLKQVLYYRNQILVILIPLLLLPLPILGADQKSRCAYVMVLMSLFWLLQVLPLALTGLIPVVLLPMMSIMDTKEIANAFFKDFTITVMGGFVVANAMEKSGLHRRVALNIIKVVGSKQHLLLLGLMAPSLFLSMWVSNLPTCVLMVSIAEELVSQLEEQARDDLQAQSELNFKEDPDVICLSDDISLENTTFMSIKSDRVGDCPSNDAQTSGKYSNSQHVHVDLKDDAPEAKDSDEVLAMKSWFDNLRTCYALGIAYTSAIGGSMIISGTPYNLLAKDLTDSIWQKHGFAASPMNFTSWLILNIPTGIIIFFVMWGWFCLHFLGWGACNLRPGARKYSQMESDKVAVYLKKELKNIGKLSITEGLVISSIVLIILLWFFLDPDFMPGWASIFPKGFVTMSVPSAIVMLIMAAIPVKGKTKQTNSVFDTVPVLGDFGDMCLKFPWAVILLVGGGRALAVAMAKTGLSDWMATQLLVLENAPIVLLMLILSLLVTTLTEVIANGVAITMFVPIASRMAETLGKNPLYLIFPVALSATYSFVLPMASIVNAWILTSGHATVRDSIKVGPIINVASVLVNLLGMHTWGSAYFDFDTIPWANSSLSDNTNMLL